MTRRIPIIPTVVVAAAVATMIWLGFWQLDRKDEKEALIAHHETALTNSERLDRLPLNGEAADFLYRLVRFECPVVDGWRSIAGRNAHDQAGYVHIAHCALSNPVVSDASTFDAPFDAEVVLGWSRDPLPPEWDGGRVEGMISRGGEATFHIVADPPFAGLEANATPDPGDLPNNHLSYAVQWFLFALTALVIYVLALRRRGG